MGAILAFRVIRDILGLSESDSHEPSTSLLCGANDTKYVQHAHIVQTRSRQMKHPTTRNQKGINLTRFFIPVTAIFIVSLTIIYLTPDAVITGTQIHPTTPTRVSRERMPTEPNAPFVRPPSVTPMLVSKTTDRAKDLPDSEKSVFIVQRKNGTYEQIIIPSHYAGDIRELMVMSPQDIIINSWPLIPRRAIPPAPTPMQRSYP